MIKMLEELSAEGRGIALKINEDKTKMKLNKMKKKSRVQFEEYLSDEVDKFKYVGVMIASSEERDEEIRKK